MTTRASSSEVSSSSSTASNNSATEPKSKRHPAPRWAWAVMPHRPTGQGDMQLMPDRSAAPDAVT
jgi:hypothetical protein